MDNVCSLRSLSKDLLPHITGIFSVLEEANDE
jgi:hypothetical protein